MISRKVPSDSDIYRSTGELREFAGEKYWALLGHTGKREGLPRAGRAPPQGLVRIGLGGGAAPPPSFPFLFPFLLSYSYYMEGLLVGLGKEGILLPVGVGLLPGAPSLGRPPLPLASLYTGAGGHPMTHKLIYGSFLSRVRCPLHHIPPRSYRRGV